MKIRENHRHCLDYLDVTVALSTIVLFIVLSSCTPLRRARDRYSTNIKPHPHTADTFQKKAK